MKAKVREQQEARRLRKVEGLPMKVIAKRLGVSVGSVHLWTKDIEISPEHARRNLQNARAVASRSWAERNRRRRADDQAKGRERARRGDDPLHRAGCMLFWAEGGKQRNVVQFCNSDPHMLASFRRFLCECFNVDASALAFRLHVYLNGDLALREIEDHWLRELDLPRSCLRGHAINPLPTSSSGEYAEFEEPRWLDGPARKAA